MCDKCQNGSNNIHMNYPPIMADGRNFTAWQPGSKLSADIRKQSNLKTNWQYRQYMQDNADKIIAYNQLASCDQCGACPMKYGVQPKQTTNTPAVFSSIDVTQTLGYPNSDLKSQYLSKYQLERRLYTPVLTQEQLLRDGYKNYN